MSNRLSIIAVSAGVLAAVALVAGPLSAALPQAAGSVAFVDRDRVFAESTMGQTAEAQIEANFEGWQRQLSGLQEEMQGLMQQRQSQAGLMTIEQLSQLDFDIEQKQVNLQRMQDDAQRQFTSIRGSIIGLLEAALLPEIAGLAQELGYTAVFNTQTPGLLFSGDGVDITDQLIARLNAIQE